MKASYGIVLKKKPYSESDEIVTVLLREDGVQRFFVRGARRSQKRFGGLLDCFAYLNFYYQLKSTGLSHLDRVEAGPVSTQTWTETRHFALAHFAAELICEFIPEGVVDPVLFDLWLRMQRDLNEKGFSIGLALHYLKELIKRSGFAVPIDPERPFELADLVSHAEQMMHKKSASAPFLMSLCVY